MSDMNFSRKDKLTIILLKEHERNSYIKSYHAYMMKWNSTLGELLKARLRPENEFVKFSVAV